MCHDDPLEGLDCCHSVNPFTEDPRICCDCDGRCCAHFRAEDRDCFWPEFTHPTWLCCRVLYGCDPHDCPFSENEAATEDSEDHDEDERRHHHHRHHRH